MHRERDRETHRETQRESETEREIAEHSALNGYIHQIPPLRTEVILWKGKCKDFKIKRVWNIARKQDPLITKGLMHI